MPPKINMSSKYKSRSTRLALIAFGWSLPIDGVASGRVWACRLRSRLVSLHITFKSGMAIAPTIPYLWYSIIVANIGCIAKGLSAACKAGWFLLK